MGLSIIIVNYNCGTVLRDCIVSIQTHSSLELEVVIVDNNSSDNSIALINKIKTPNFPIKIIINEQNVGFSKANNIGINQAQYDNILFLNPDSLVSERLINEIFDVIQDPDKEYIYIADIEDPLDGINKTIRSIPIFKNQIRRQLNLEYDKWYLGAFILTNKSALSRIGFWSEEFFLYGEDMDFFYKMIKKKIKVRKLMNKVTHIGNVSGKKALTEKEKTLLQFRALEIFYKKHRLHKFNLYSFHLFSGFIILLKHRDHKIFKSLALFTYNKFFNKGYYERIIEKLQQ